MYYTVSVTTKLLLFTISVHTPLPVLSVLQCVADTPVHWKQGLRETQNEWQPCRSFLHQSGVIPPLSTSSHGYKKKRYNYQLTLHHGPTQLSWVACMNREFKSQNKINIGIDCDLFRFVLQGIACGTVIGSIGVSHKE